MAAQFRAESGTRGAWGSGEEQRRPSSSGLLPRDVPPLSLAASLRAAEPLFLLPNGEVMPRLQLNKASESQTWPARVVCSESFRMCLYCYSELTRTHKESGSG